MILIWKEIIHVNQCWLLCLLPFLKSSCLKTILEFFLRIRSKLKAFNTQSITFSILISSDVYFHPTAALMPFIYVHIHAFLCLPFWSPNLRELKQVEAWQHRLENLMFDLLLGKQDSQCCNLSKCHKRVQ